MRSRHAISSILSYAFCLAAILLLCQRTALAGGIYPNCDSFNVTVVPASCGPLPNGQPGWCCDCQNPLALLSSVNFTAYFNRGTASDFQQPVNITTPGLKHFKITDTTAHRLDSIKIGGQIVYPDNQEHHIPIPGHTGWCFKVVIGPTFAGTPPVAVCPMNIDICAVPCSPCDGGYQISIDVDPHALPITITNNWSDGGVTTKTYSLNGRDTLYAGIARPGSGASVTSVSFAHGLTSTAAFNINPIPAGHGRHVAWVPDSSPYCWSVLIDTTYDSCSQCWRTRIMIVRDSCDHSIYESGGGGSLGALPPAKRPADIASYRPAPKIEAVLGKEEIVATTNVQNRRTRIKR